MLNVLVISISVFIALVGLISGGVSIWMFIESRQHPAFKRRGLIFGVVFVVMIVIAFGVTGIEAWVSSRSETTSFAENLLLRAISSPDHASVLVTLLSVTTTPNQHLQYNFIFKNNGSNICQNIKIYEITLIDSTGAKYQPIGQPSPSWTLDVGKTIEQSPIFQEPAQQGLRYTLRLSLDVGGCVIPPDKSKNRYADYQSVSFSI